MEDELLDKVREYGEAILDSLPLASSVHEKVEIEERAVGWAGVYDVGGYSCWNGRHSKKVGQLLVKGGANRGGREICVGSLY